MIIKRTSILLAFIGLVLLIIWSKAKIASNLNENSPIAVETLQHSQEKSESQVLTADTPLSRSQTMRTPAPDSENIYFPEFEKIMNRFSKSKNYSEKLNCIAKIEAQSQAESKRSLVVGKKLYSYYVEKQDCQTSIRKSTSLKLIYFLIEANDNFILLLAIEDQKTKNRIWESSVQLN